MLDEKRIISLGQKMYALCVIAMGIQQLAYGEISPNFLPLALATNPVYKILVYPWGVAFTLSGIAYLVNRKGFEISLVYGWILLFFFIFIYAPYFIFFSEVGNQFIQWAPAFQTLSFTGSSLILAGSFKKDDPPSNSLLRAMSKLIPFGGAFFSVMLIGYGIDHFLYAKPISGMVPSWIPGSMFWTYFAGVALVGAGIAITFRIKLKLVGILLAAMLFSWLLILHLPRAIANPVAVHGLELTRCFVTFGFTGIGLLIAFGNRRS
jgi:uncharacterized membrane protein